jgi:hypothetical protein
MNVHPGNTLPGEVPNVLNVHQGVYPALSQANVKSAQPENMHLRTRTCVYDVVRSKTPCGLRVGPQIVSPAKMDILHMKIVVSVGRINSRRIWRKTHDVILCVSILPMGVMGYAGIWIAEYVRMDKEPTVTYVQPRAPRAHVARTRLT